MKHLCTRRLFLVTVLTFLVAAMLISTAGCQVAPAPTPVPGDAGPSQETSPEAEEPAAPEQGTTYKIGFMAAITGGASFLGVPERDAAVMIQKQLDAQGGTIIGPDGVEHPVELLIHDTEGSGDVAIQVAKKLINDDGAVAVIGTTRSASSMALLPVMQEAEVPMISMASSSSIVEPVSERTWVFKTAQSNKHTAPWQVRYAKAKGLTKIANMYVNNAYGEDGAQAIRDAAAEEGIEIVLEDTFSADDSDMTAQLTKLRASEAEALLVTALPPAAPILTKQFREMGFEMPIVHNHGIGMKPFIDLAGEAAEGVVFPMGKLVAVGALPDSDPQKAVLEQFIADYEANSDSPVSTFAGHAWDAVKIVLMALEQIPADVAPEELPARVRDEIEAIDGFVGISGVFHFSAEDHVGMSVDDVVLCRISDGEWHYYPPEEW